MSNEKTHPGVFPAYEVALRSYDWLLNRANSKDTILVGAMSWVTASTIAFMAWTLPKANLDASHPLFILGVAFSLTAVCFGFYALQGGTLKFADPGALFQRQLHRTDWDFKRRFIFRSGESFEHNANLIERKSRGITRILWVFVLEAATFGVWLIVNLRDAQ